MIVINIPNTLGLNNAYVNDNSINPHNGISNQEASATVSDAT